MESYTEENGNYETIEDMNTAFSKKIFLIRECLKLRIVPDSDINTVFGGVEKAIDDVRKTFKLIRDEIKGGQKKLTEMQNLQKKLESINKRLSHMENNIPAVLNKAESVVPQKEIKAEILRIGPAASNKMVAKMKYVTVAEFDSVPSYMKGRIKYDQINKFVDEFNVALDGKYKVLAMPRKGMSAANLKVWQKLKAQENADTKGFFFCTADDLKEYGCIKCDRITINMLTILRHCSKMKEIRRPGPIVRYAVLT